jgi:hypothetical protein
MTEKFDTLDSTFGAFFSEPEPTKKCKECGATANLEVWYHAHNDKPVYRCRTCREKYEAEQAASEEKHRRQMDEIIWRNEWEE